MFGGHFSHLLLNWKEDKHIFSRAGYGKDPTLVPEKYARWGRSIRLITLIIWVVAEVGTSIDEKILPKVLNEKCPSRRGSSNNWWCYTQTNYCSHIYGFLAG